MHQADNMIIKNSICYRKCSEYYHFSEGDTKGQPSHEEGCMNAKSESHLVGPIGQTASEDRSWKDLEPPGVEWPKRKGANAWSERV